VDIASRNRLSVLSDAFIKYPIRRGSVSGVASFDQMESCLVAMLSPSSVQKIDGLKLVFEDGWTLVRQSGTEPRVRLTVEAGTEARARSVYEQVEELIMEQVRK
jgi:phosphoglucosamine mutase